MTKHEAMMSFICLRKKTQNYSHADMTSKALSQSGKLMTSKTKCAFGFKNINKSCVSSERNAVAVNEFKRKKLF